MDVVEGSWRQIMTTIDAAHEYGPVTSLSRYVAAALVLVAACSGSREPEASDTSSAPVPCAGGGGILAGDRVGTLRLGMSLDSAKVLCPAGIDTVQYDEGERIRVLLAASGPDTIIASVNDGTVGTLWTTSPAFVTADSMRAGSALSRLLRLPSLTGGSGEGRFYLWNEGEEECGMSFLLDESTARRLQRVSRVTVETLRPFATTGRITAVLVRGCTRPQMPPT